MTRTIRVIILQNNKLLLLEKTKNSKNPNKLELPGGKVEENESLFEAAIKEVQEETQVTLTANQLQQLDYEFDYSFEHDNNKYERRVFYFKAYLESKPIIEINKTLDENGESEDNHSSFRWVSLEEYKELVEQESIAKNSQINTKLL